MLKKGEKGKVRSVMPRIIAKRLTESDAMTHEVRCEVHPSRSKERNEKDDGVALSLLAASHIPCAPHITCDSG
jgi:hypothetical protein